jgi:hypothetical protein
MLRDIIKPILILQCIKPNAVPCRLIICFLRLLVAEDVAVTSIKDGHGRAPEELAAGSSKLNL